MTWLDVWDSSICQLDGWEKNWASFHSFFFWVLSCFKLYFWIFLCKNQWQEVMGEGQSWKVTRRPCTLPTKGTFCKDKADKSKNVAVGLQPYSWGKSKSFLRKCSSPTERNGLKFALDNYKMDSELKIWMTIQKENTFFSVSKDSFSSEPYIICHFINKRLCELHPHQAF